MKKTKLSFRALRIAVVSVFALAVLALTGCDGGGGTGPSMVTVTFNGNSALVTGTMPAPQTVTSGTSITLPGQTGFNKPEHALAGWNTNADGTGTTLSPGSTLTVTSNVTLFAIWAVPVAMDITVTGITGDFGGGAELALMHPGTMSPAYWDFSSITGGSVTFSITAIPGTYDIHLRLEAALFVIASREIVAGTNTVAFGDFARAELRITVTGIPNAYFDGWGRFGQMTLFAPGNFTYYYWITGHSTGIDSSSVTFTLAAISGTYDIRLQFEFYCDEEDDWVYSVYILSSRSLVAGPQTIPLSEFTRIDPISITVTGILNTYIDGDGFMILNTPGYFDWVDDSWTWIDDSSATFRFFVLPGTYDIRLEFYFWCNEEDEEMMSVYILSSRNLVAGNQNIALGQFTRLNPITITVTGIDARYNGMAGDIALLTPGTYNVVAWGWQEVETNTTFTVFVLPGTYDISLWFIDYGNGEFVGYHALSRSITAGVNTISFNTFTYYDSGILDWWSFTETLELSGRAAPDSSRARASALRAR